MFQIPAIRAALAATLLVLVLTPGPVQTAAPATAIDPAKATLIRRLITLSRSVDMAVNAIEASIPEQAAAAPQVPPAFWEEFAVQAHQAAPRMVEMLVPIYDRHYTRTQLEQLVKFFESPVGQAMVKAQPAILEASNTAGQEWGAEVGRKTAEELSRRGIVLPR